MNKDDAITFLRRKGYAVENDRGVVTIITDKVISKKEYLELLSMLRNHDYTSSFGIKPVLSGQVIETKVSDEIIDNNEDLEDFDADEEDIIDSDEQLSFFENGNGQLSFL